MLAKKEDFYQVGKLYRTHEIYIRVYREENVTLTKFVNDEGCKITKFTAFVDSYNSRHVFLKVRSVALILKISEFNFAEHLLSNGETHLIVNNKVSKNYYIAIKLLLNNNIVWAVVSKEKAFGEFERIY